MTNEHSKAMMTSYERATCEISREAITRHQAERDYWKLDSEFEKTIELVDAMMHGPAPLEEVLQRQGISNLGTQAVIDYINQRILFFYNLGKP